MSPKRHSEAAERNKGPIADVLADVLPAAGEVLEIASGSGQHALHFAGRFPELQFTPSDPSAEARASVESWRVEAGLPNLRPPLALDVLAPPSELGHYDAIVCCNMIHIAPWAATEGLFALAARVLRATGVLVTYGPYRFDGVFTAPSNAEFDRSLRARDPAWGVRDVADVDRVAACHGFTRVETRALPANNHALVWRVRS